MCPPDDPSHDDDDASLPSPPSAADRAQSEVAKLVAELVLHPRAVLPKGNAARIRMLADAARQPLIAILVDSKLRDPQGPGASWGPVHAARLLGELFPKQAVEPLLDTLATTSQLTPLREALTKALSPLGPPLIAPILARLPTAVGAYRRELWSLLAGVGVRDPRVFAQLLAALAESPEDGAMHLAEYGDPDALPDLSRALAAYRVGLGDDVRGDHTVFELREAILELGGTLTLEQEAKYQRALWGRRIQVSVQSEAKRESPVRADDPCPCGSGRPYKFCHLQ